MAYKIIFAPTAIARLEDIVRHIAADDPEAAKIFAMRLLERADLLSEFPELGTQVGAFEQTHCKNLGSLRVVGCDVPNDVFESRNCSRREDYFVSHRPSISRTRSTGTPRPASSSAALSSEASKAASSLSRSEERRVGK